MVPVAIMFLQFFKSLGTAFTKNAKGILLHTDHTMAQVIVTYTISVAIIYPDHQYNK